MRGPARNRSSRCHVGRRCSLGVALFSSQEALRAQDVNKPAIPPQPRTINLTQEQRFIIKENAKDLALSKAAKDAPETIGDPVPVNIVLHALPSEVGAKVPQVRSHMFFIKDGNNVIVLVSPTDRRIADVSARCSSQEAYGQLHLANSSSNALASFRSSVSKPSVNQL
jgi:hypothetical protein